MLKVLVYALAGLHALAESVEAAISEHAVATAALTNPDGTVKAEVYSAAKDVASVAVASGQAVVGDLVGAGEASALAALSSKVGPANASLIVGLAGSVVSAIAAQAAAQTEPVSDVVETALQGGEQAASPEPGAEPEVIKGTALDDGAAKAE